MGMFVMGVFAMGVFAKRPYGRHHKSSVTKQINITGEYDTLIQLWQRNYYEHIIRNEKSYQRISEYIINNPAKGRDDKFYK